MITSFRMYNAVPRAAQAWRALFARVFADVGLDIEVIDHGWPQPIAELWQRPGLCCAFMCGWPFIRSGRMQAIAAPVPAPPRYGNQPRYCSEFLVRGASGWESLEETFGHRFGWMAADSQSGFNAPRAHLAQFTRADRPALYEEVRGPLGAPMKALEALRNEEVDVVCLDSFFLDLIRWHEPARLGDMRSVASTSWTPIPLLVAAPDVEPAIVDRLRERLLEIHDQATYRPLLSDVLLTRFAAPDVEAYRTLDAMEVAARDRGYAEIR